MSTCPKCTQEFDELTTYVGIPRRCGPRRGFCSLKCAKQKQEEEKGYARSAALRSRYGISADEYELVRQAQDSKCAICGSHETTVSPVNGSLFSLNVDHDHDTKRIRGLLCTPCNRGLGFLRDDRSILVKAIEYLDADGAHVERLLSAARERGIDVSA